MIIVDNALKERERTGRPIRVGMVGAGFMGQGLTNQITNSVAGMRMAAVYNRRQERAEHVFRYSGLEDVVVADTQLALDTAIQAGRPAVAEDPFMICRSDQIDVVVDVTGSVEFGANVILEAFRHGKHVVLMNAEVDATIGPILQVYAKQHGVILSACDGDEPGLQMNLYRWVKGLGLIPRVVGNVKGLQDPYRNPTTQKAWAERWVQNPAMVTSFADGSKISFEQSIVANATGFKVRQRGMTRGQVYDGSIMDIHQLYDLDELRELGGVVDYTVGPAGVKIFCLAEHSDPKQRHYLNLYKMGEGPLYPFWVPYHLVHFEAPNAIARVVLFGDNLAPPLAGPVVEVCAVAKRDLEAGEVLDEYGNYMTYGEAANVEEMSTMRYLPEGLVEGCRLKRAIRKDEVLTYDDVELPSGRIADSLRAEQYRHFRNETWLEEHLRTKGQSLAS
jgi:predicted homoserine dehydrogenase-like protein